MRETGQVTYAIHFGARSKVRGRNATAAKQSDSDAVPRIARLLALAIRMEGLIREQRLPDYAAAARLGGVTRARVTQIMKLCDLASDIQEQILFLPSGGQLNERNLRPISKVIDWNEQRRLFQAQGHSVTSLAG
jgi:hypothetical protein